MPNLKITILFDNYNHDSNCKCGWGFSCYIETDEKHILFDTGESSKKLQHNIKTLGVDIYKTDFIFISHRDYDHVGGFSYLYSLFKDRTVYIPQSYQSEFEREYPDYKSDNVYPINSWRELFPGFYSTGEEGPKKKEHSLVIETGKGPILITGCAHQGIDHLIEKVNNKFEKVPYLVLGGFHMKDMKPGKITSIIEQFRKIGIKNVAPTHCTGKLAMKRFKEEYDERFFELGAGRVIILQGT